MLIATGCVPGSDDGEAGYAWLALMAGNESAACATFWGSSTSTAGRKLLVLGTSASRGTPMYGPFWSPSGVYVKVAGTGASAIVAVNASSLA